MSSVTDAARVVVFGAYGHTGLFVVEELIRRGMRPILCGRDAARLRSVQDRFHGLEVRVAALDDETSLDRALASAKIVINCAGPFLDTAMPVAQAALRAHAHYLDVAAEQRAVQRVYASLDGMAKHRGAVVVPGMGFYGGLGDLLATWAMDDWTDADEIDVGAALSYWHPTLGTRRTGERNTYARVVVHGGELAPAPTPLLTKEWRFPEPLGLQEMVGLPFAEIVVIHRHLRSERLTHWLNKRALEDVRDAATPAPTASDALGRSSQEFTMLAEVRRAGMLRSAHVSGTDIYAISATLLGEAVVRLLHDPKPPAGARAPGELFDADAFLNSLSPVFTALERQGTALLSITDQGSS